MPPDRLAVPEASPKSAAESAASQYPLWAENPPVPPEGSLVPNSRFHEEQWIMAAGMLARGASFVRVAQAMGCSRSTLWRAYYGSQPFRLRVWWEREAANREAELRLASLRVLVAEQIERLISAGDPGTVRWLADRLGLFKSLPDERREERRDTRPTAHPEPATPEPTAAPPAAPVTAPLLDDDIPGAFRERTPPNPAYVAAILARPEADGPKGVYPWTLNPDDHYPSLGSARERQGGQGAFSRSR